MEKRLASNLIRKHKTQCPFEISSRININVRFLDLPDGCRGYYLKTLRRRFIAINSNLSYEWQRIVCAHELGHDRMHAGIGYYFIEKNTLFNPGKYERQANQFAVSLLTGGKSPDYGETLEMFLLRKGIPVEMMSYYD